MSLVKLKNGDYVSNSEIVKISKSNSVKACGKYFGFEIEYSNGKRIIEMYNEEKDL